MMKKIFFFALLQTLWATGFSKSLSLQKLGDSFQRTNLEVRWNISTNALPSTVWIYHLSPKIFPQEAISNLIALGRFTAQQIKKSNADEVVYKNADKHPTKQLAVSHGSIEYLHSIKYGPTNLTEDVPEMGRLLQLTTNLLSDLDINISDIEKKTNGAPNFHFAEFTTLYYLSDKTITNVEFRIVRFSRAIDGATFISGGAGGDGEFDFGAHGDLVGIDLSWRDMERYKSCPTTTPETIVKWIREGKAVQGGIPMNSEAIDWPTVKSLTINKADLCYYAGERFAPSQWLMPLLSLWTTVDPYFPD
jgi:hypothetical protein